MNLLGAITYDPGTAVSKATTSLLAMTAIDTTNLRIAFTIPAHGMVRVRLSCVLHGSTTTPVVLLGILEGSTVRGRQSSMQTTLAASSIATTQYRLDVEYILTGLTPGAVNWDAAYGVEIIASASGGLKYGGPDDTTTNNAFGGFVFEVWDPQPQSTGAPLYVDANGRVDVIKIAGTTQTARDLGASVIAASVTGMTASDVGAIKAKTDNLPAAPASTTNITAASGVALSVAGVQAIWDALTSALTTVGSIGKKLADWTIGTAQTGDSYARIGAAGAGLTALGDARIANLDAAVSSRNATTPPSAATNASAVRTELTTELARVDAAISSRNAVAPATPANVTSAQNTIIAAIPAATSPTDIATEVVTQLPPVLTIDDIRQSLNLPTPNPDFPNRFHL